VSNNRHPIDQEIYDLVASLNHFQIEKRISNSFDKKGVLTKWVGGFLAIFGMA
jgi:hypothetical protein